MALDKLTPEQQETLMAAATDGLSDGAAKFLKTFGKAEVGKYGQVTVSAITFPTEFSEEVAQKLRSGSTMSPDELPEGNSLKFNSKGMAATLRYSSQKKYTTVDPDKPDENISETVPEAFILEARRRVDLVNLNPAAKTIVEGVLAERAAAAARVEQEAIERQAMREKQELQRTQVVEAGKKAIADAPDLLPKDIERLSGLSTKMQEEFATDKLAQGNPVYGEDQGTITESRIGIDYYEPTPYSIAMQQVEDARKGFVEAVKNAKDYRSSIVGRDDGQADILPSVAEAAERYAQAFEKNKQEISSPYRGSYFDNAQKLAGMATLIAKGQSPQQVREAQELAGVRVVEELGPKSTSAIIREMEQQRSREGMTIPPEVIQQMLAPEPEADPKNGPAKSTDVAYDFVNRATFGALDAISNVVTKFTGRQ